MIRLTSRHTLCLAIALVVFLVGPVSITDGAMVNYIDLEKQFINDPVYPGDPVTLEFTLTNVSPSFAIEAISFTDDLNAALAGLEATSLPMFDICGPGSMLSGTSTLSLAGGSLGPGMSATFQVNLQVPSTAFPGTYINTTSPVTALDTAGGSASDDLIIIPEPTSLSILLAGLAAAALKRRK